MTWRAFLVVIITGAVLAGIGFTVVGLKTKCGPYYLMASAPDSDVLCDTLTEQILILHGRDTALRFELPKPGAAGTVGPRQEPPQPQE